MARKIRGFERVLDVPSLAAVAFGEIGSSVYFALGIVAFFALGLTPWVLLLVGAVFACVSLSYAEATSALPEAGGASAFVRRAFSDPAGFFTGWVVFLDYLIVIALAALFVPHYVGAAFGWSEITRDPWDGIAGVGVILVLVAVRLVRRARLYAVAIAVAALASFTFLVLVLLSFVLLGSGDALTANVDLGRTPPWSSLAFALPLAALAFTGLETVANLGAEAREPGRTLPTSLFVGIGAAVLSTVLVAVAALFAQPVAVDPGAPHGFSTPIAVEWRRAPLVGIAAGFEDALPAAAVDALRAFVGVTAVVVLVAAASTSISGAARLARTLSERHMLPRALGRLSRRTLVAPAAIVSAALASCVLLLLADSTSRPGGVLASLYSFGVLLAFTAAQVAVVRLRIREPGLDRPFRAPANVRVRGTDVPLPALVGAPLTFALWLIAMVTHDSARIAGPIWLLVGAVLFVVVRWSAGEGLTEAVEPARADLVPEQAEGTYERILVPLKLGEIGDEVLATAIKLADEEHANVSVLHVLRVPLDRPLDAELPEVENRAEAALAEARDLAGEHGIEVEAKVVRARSIGEAVVAEADEQNADLIVLGSAPRWRRQSRFFSPTVDYVLRNAPCEVMVVAYPEGVLEPSTVET